LEYHLSITSKLFAVAGLAATVAMAGFASAPASAQTHSMMHPMMHSTMHHMPKRMAKKHLTRLHRSYARDVSHGNYKAAEQAHLRAVAIRARLHAREMRHREYGMHHHMMYPSHDWHHTMMHHMDHTH
jgi:hypothetical protein